MSLDYITFQEARERIALLEWFVAQGEADRYDKIELRKLKQLSRAYTKKVREYEFKKALALAQDV